MPRSSCAVMPSPTTGSAPRAWPPAIPPVPATPSTAPWPPRWRVPRSRPSPPTCATPTASPRCPPSAPARPLRCRATTRCWPASRAEAAAMRIGPYAIEPRVVLAPMAGVTDKPFRLLCKQLGAGLAVSEMTISDPRFWNTPKSLRRMDHAGEPDPVSVQIAGTEPRQLAEAARYNVDQGAQIIDINMGCPATKVCNAWAGSALMREEALVARILEAVVAAVEVPVTLKIRTGWCAEVRNAPAIARIAEDAGIAALAIHGRTRNQHYTGQAEYDTIAEVKSRLRIPVVANGDIDSPAKAAFVLAYTGADAVMVGRAAQGRPWIFRQIAHYLATGEELPEPAVAEV